MILDWFNDYLPIFIALLGAGGVIKLLEFWLNRAKFAHDARRDGREDLRLDMADLRKEMRDFKVEYQTLEKDFEVKKGEIVVLQAEIYALKQDKLRQDYEFKTRWWAARSIFDRLLAYIRKAELGEDEEFQRLEEAVRCLYEGEEDCD